MSKSGLHILAAVFFWLAASDCNFTEPPIDDTLDDQFTVENVFADGINLKSNYINDLYIHEGKLYVATRGGGIAVYDGTSWDDLHFSDAVEATDTTWGDLSGNPLYLLPEKIVSNGQRIILGYDASASAGSGTILHYDGTAWQTNWSGNPFFDASGVSHTGGVNHLSAAAVSGGNIYFSNYEYGLSFPPDLAHSSCTGSILCGQMARINSSGDLSVQYYNLANTPVNNTTGTASGNSPNHPQNVEKLAVDTDGNLVALVQRWYDPEYVDGVDGSSGTTAAFNCEIGLPCKSELVIVRTKKENPVENISTQGRIVTLNTDNRFSKVVTAFLYERITLSREVFWIGTTSGLLKVQVISLLTRQTEEILYSTSSAQDIFKLPTNYVTALAKTDSLWIGTEDGLVRSGDAGFITYKAEDLGLPDNQITALAADGDTLYVGTPGGLAIVRPR